MYKLKDYIKLIRYTCIIDNIMYFYFIRIIVLILLNKNIVNWISVSIPIVLELSRLLSRTINKVLDFSIKINFKKYHLIYIISFSIISIIITLSNNVILIYLLTFILGLLTGIRRSSVLNFNTSNNKYESKLFMEEERSQVIGASIGLILSQLLYDINYIYYILFYLIIILFSILINKYTKNIIINYNYEKKEEKIDKILIKKVILFGILSSLWYIAIYSYEELAPLISNKIGYLNSLYTILEFILLFIITGNFIDKLIKNNKLILSLTIISLIDITSLLIASLLLNVYGLVIAYILSSIVSTLGEPIYESIISMYSNNNKNKYILVNKIVYLIRTIFTIISFIICKYIITNNIIYFRYLGIILIFLVIIIFIILRKK